MGYAPRMWAIAALMAASYGTVAFSATRPWQLLGVAFGAAQACRLLPTLLPFPRTLTPTPPAAP